MDTTDLLGRLVWLPLQGPLVVLSVLTIVTSLVILLQRRNTPVWPFIVLALLPFLFCAVHISVRRVTPLSLIADLRSGSAEYQIVVGERSDGRLLTRSPTPEETAQEIEAWGLRATPYPLLDETIATLVFLFCLSRNWSFPRHALA